LTDLTHFFESTRDIAWWKDADERAERLLLRQRRKLSGYPSKLQSTSLVHQTHQIFRFLRHYVNARYEILIN